MQTTRDKILDAVFKLVYINGYNGTSMSMILKECDIPKGSLYHHFKSKKEMVLSVIRERLSLRIDEFYEFKKVENEHSIDTIISNILKIAQKDELVKYGCPLNRLNQEMSPIDSDFEIEIDKIYINLRDKISLLLKDNDIADADSLAEYIIASVWGALSLSPEQSSKQRYLDTVSHLVKYLKSQII